DHQATSSNPGNPVFAAPLRRSLSPFQHGWNSRSGCERGRGARSGSRGADRAVWGDIFSRKEIRFELIGGWSRGTTGVADAGRLWGVTSVCRCSPSRWGISLVPPQANYRHREDTVVMNWATAQK